LNTRNTIEKLFADALIEANQPAPDRFDDDLVLLESGLDSLGFAILVTQLEETLGYDPFTLMTEPVYPRTFSEFVGIYEKFEEHAK
jgi:hypothetical protein